MMGFVVRQILVVLGIVIGLLVANRPRFWWQEQFHNLALLWIVPAVAAAISLICYLLRQRRWSWPVAGAIVGYLFAAAYMSLRLQPYVYDGRPVSSDQLRRGGLRGFWVESITSNERVAECMRAIQEYSPQIVVLSGSSLERFRDAFPEDVYPHRRTFQGSGDEQISLFSSLAFGSGGYQDLGFDAAPGGFVPLLVDGGKILQLGVVTLARSIDKVSFERNRVSSRRLSALTRNSVEARIILAHFRATLFSQLAAVYPEQTKVKTARAGQGIVRGLAVGMYSGTRAGSDLFVSRDVQVVTFAEVDLPSRERPAFYFQLEIERVPGTSSAMETPFVEAGIE